MDNLNAAPFTGALTKAGLAAGTTTTLTQTLAAGATANVIAIRGKMYSVAALSNTATPTVDYATGKAFLPVLANQGSAFMVGFNAAGALKVIQGNVVPLDTITVPGGFLNAPQFGALGPAGSVPGAGGSNDFCPIGYLLIQAGSTASNTTGWVFGTNNMAAVTGITYTFDDVCGITDRPQIS
jgi:hypothetical protein